MTNDSVSRSNSFALISSGKKTNTRPALSFAVAFALSPAPIQSAGVPHSLFVAAILLSHHETVIDFESSGSGKT
jgi:hypothetical protein